MKKINTTLLLGALLGFCACHFESFDERCAREAREYTEKQCPRRMDQYTLMDSLTYDDHSRTLNYYYTLEGVLDNNTVMNAQACESLKDLLRKNVVNSVDLKSYKEKGISFSYYYYSKASGKVRFHVRFTPEDYDSNYSPNR